MKNKKEGNAALAGILIVVIILLALVVPYTLSLVDTTPPGDTGTIFTDDTGGMGRTAYIAERIEFYEDVEVSSLYADLSWQTRVGTCEMVAYFQTTNVVVSAPVVEFHSQTFSQGDGLGDDYLQPTASGMYELLRAGQWWLVFFVACLAADEADDWFWHEYGGSTDYDHAVVNERGVCTDLDRNGIWEGPGECRSTPRSYVLEGRLSLVGPSPDPPNVTSDVTGPNGGPVLIDTDVDEDYDWIMWAILGGVIIIVLVVVVVAVKW